MKEIGIVRLRVGSKLLKVGANIWIKTNGDPEWKGYISVVLILTGLKILGFEKPEEELLKLKDYTLIEVNKKYIFVPKNI